MCLYILAINILVYMKSPVSTFSSSKTQLLYDILTSFHETTLKQQKKKEVPKVTNTKDRPKQQQGRIRRICYKTLQSQKWKIQSSSSKSPRSKQKNKYYPQTTKNNKANAYFKSERFTARDNINIIDNDSILQLNNSSSTNKRKVKDQSKPKSRLFTQSKLQSIKKTIQFVQIYSKSKPYVYIDKNTPILAKLLKGRYWLEPTNQIEKAHFLWVNYKDFIHFQRIRIEQIKNGRQLQESYLINYLSLDSTNLLSQLVAAPNQCIPLTLTITNNKQLKNILNTISQQQKIKYWIIKPLKRANFSNSHICTTQQIKQYLKNILKSNHYQPSQFIQEYIYNPFLYNKRKFIIKTHLLVTNINKITKAYLYNLFRIQTSALEYKADSRNLCIHYTGNQIQRQSKYYGRYEQNNRISMQEFDRYLEGQVKKDQEIYIDYRETIRQICIEIANNIANKTNNYYDHLNYFQLFELNFLMQNNCSPLLVNIKNEINLNTKYLQKQSQKLIQNALKLSLDVIYPPPLSYLNRFQPTVEHFQIIFDSRQQGIIESLPLNIK